VPLLFAIILFLQTPAPAPCADAAECRAQAELAASRGDFETFHDLAWRAVQKGRKNDTDLMFLLARAQSLSGRPDDALVMLERIVNLGGKPDATLPDFARVRQLAGWPELAARLGLPADAAAPSSPSAPSPSAASATETPASPSASSASSPTVSPSAPIPATSARSAPASASSSAPAPSPPAAPGGNTGLTFDAPSLAPVALDHDAVSRRFVVGDRTGARLVIVDEVSHHVVNYASAATAGFYNELTAFAIDPRRGDLWVTSAKGDGPDAASAVHKLQLVSGRTLMEVRLPEKSGATKLVGVAVTPDGTVYAIDAISSRLFRARPGGRQMDVVARLDVHNPTAITAPDDRALYVGSDDGLARVDLATNTVTRIKSVEQLTRFTSLAWHSNALVGVERVGDSYLVVRVALDNSGTRAQPRAILAASVDPIVGTLTPEGYYYLAAGSIRLVKVR
jgi:hypothetical protein